MTAPTITEDQRLLAVQANQRDLATAVLNGNRAEARQLREQHSHLLAARKPESRHR